MTSPTTSAATSKFTASGNPTLDPLLNQSFTKWGGALGTGASLSFSFPYLNGSSATWQTNYGVEPNASSVFGLNPTQVAAARGALQAWANVANLTFTEVADTSSNVGDFRFAFSSAVPSTDWGYSFTPNNFYAVAADVWINTARGSDANWSVGTYNFEAMMHEIGHGLGLKHPGNYNGTGAGTPPFIAAALDFRNYSIMSYNDPTNNLFRKVTQNTDGTYKFDTFRVREDSPMVLDVQAMQYLYGANTTYKTGNDVYTFDPATPFFRTIWDAGGNDTISVANFSLGCVINLQPGQYSSISMVSDPLPSGYSGGSVPTYDGKNNLGIAYNCIIENATGGSGNDRLIGNAANNNLIGGAGDDTIDGGTGNDSIDGGDGTDTAVFGSAFSSYTYNYSAVTRMFTVSSVLSGTDSITNVEYFQFSDILKTASQLMTSTAVGNVFLAASVLSITEGNSGSQQLSFVVNLSSAATSAVTVNYATANGTATAGSDYTPTSGVLSFAAGETSKTITVAILGDTTVEPDETFTLSLSNPSGATLGTVTTTAATIVNDDTASMADDYAANTTTTGAVSVGGSTTGSIETANDQDWFRVSLVAGTTYTVNLEGSPTSQGTLADTVLNGTYTSAGVLVPGTFNDDGGVSPNSRVTYTPTASGTYFISAGGFGTSTGSYKLSVSGVAVPTILPQLSIAPSNSPIAEGNSGTTPYTFTVTRAGDLSAASSASWVVASSGTNPANSADFIGGVFPTGTVSFAAGQSATTVTVNVAGDTTVEPNETFTLSLSNPSGATLGTVAASTATIVNDDTTGPVIPPVTSTATTRAFLGAGNTFTAGDNNLALTGTSGTAIDTLRINSGTSGIKLDSNFERIELAGNLADFRFLVIAGTGIQIQPASTSAVIATIPSLNQNSTLAFTNGSASLVQTGGSAFALGGQPISTSAASGFTSSALAGFNAFDLSTAGTPSAASNAGPAATRVFVGSGNTFTAGDSNLSVTGTSGAARDTVRVAPGVNGVKLDANFERVELPGTLADFRFLTTPSVGAQVLLASTGAVVVTMPSLNQDATVAFTNGSATLVQTGGSAFALGGQAISTSAASSFVSSALAGFNPSDVSTVGASSAGGTVTVNAAGFSGAGGGNFTYNIASGTYTYSIAGFGVGDKLAFFAGASLAIVPDANDNDGIQSLTATNIGTAAVTTITLTGLSAAQDQALFNVPSFNTLFGAGSLA